MPKMLLWITILPLLCFSKEQLLTNIGVILPNKEQNNVVIERLATEIANMPSDRTDNVRMEFVRQLVSDTKRVQHFDATRQFCQLLKLDVDVIIPFNLGPPSENIQATGSLYLNVFFFTWLKHEKLVQILSFDGFRSKNVY